MKCPSDQAALDFMDEGVHLRHRCPKCAGLLLDRDEVAAALGGRGQGLDPGRITALPVGPRACPRDGKPMRVVQQGGVEIDLCAECGSLWLDAGELEKLSVGGKRARKIAVGAAAAAALAGGAALAANASAAPAAAPGSGLLGDVGGSVAEGAVEVVFEFVGDALGELISGIFS